MNIFDNYLPIICGNVTKNIIQFGCKMGLTIYFLKPYFGMTRVPQEGIMGYRGVECRGESRPGRWIRRGAECQQEVQNYVFTE